MMGKCGVKRFIYVVAGLALAMAVFLYTGHKVEELLFLMNKLEIFKILGKG